MDQNSLDLRPGKGSALIDAEAVAEGLTDGYKGDALLDVAGLRGGFVVCTSCDDPGLLAALRRSEAFVLQGLDASPTQVAAAKRCLFVSCEDGRVMCLAKDD